MFGFLGPNGAGKTTMVRLLTGLARPSSGSAQILGSEIAGGNATRAVMGYLPDVPGFYEWMTGREFLQLAGRLFGLPRSVLEGRIESLLELAGLGDIETKIGGYSRGMKQRLGVAQALINAPRLLILDEPTSALDPIGRKEILDMVSSLRGRATVFFSTHILSDVERVCDTVAILDHGHLVVQAPIHQLKQRYGVHKVFVEVTEKADELSREIETQPWVTAVARGANGGIDITVSDVGAAQKQIPAMVAAKGIGLSRLEAGEVQLEEVFVDLVGGEHR